MWQETLSRNTLSLRQSQSQKANIEFQLEAKVWRQAINIDILQDVRQMAERVSSIPFDTSSTSKTTSMTTWSALGCWTRIYIEVCDSWPNTLIVASPWFCVPFSFRRLQKSAPHSRSTWWQHHSWHSQNRFYCWREIVWIKNVQFLFTGSLHRNKLHVGVDHQCHQWWGRACWGEPSTSLNPEKLLCFTYPVVIVRVGGVIPIQWVGFSLICFRWKKTKLSQETPFDISAAHFCVRSLRNVAQNLSSWTAGGIVDEIDWTKYKLA